MIFELIATVLAGATMALLVWAINRGLRGRLPGWLIPASAGLAMIVVTISSEYGWFSRTQAALPGGIVVAQTVEEKALYRPWTYAKPFVSRFIAVDQASLKTNSSQPDHRIVDLLFYGRWARTAKVPMLFDCAAGRRADILDGVEFDDAGAVVDPKWIPLKPGDPVLTTACAVS